MKKGEKIFLLVVSGASSSASLVWSGFFLGNSISFFRSPPDHWSGMALLFFVTLPTLLVAVAGGMLPFLFIPTAEFSSTEGRVVKLLAWVAVGSALASGLLGLALSGRAGG